jgi:small-conductance mechanosensitive channel
MFQDIARNNEEVETVPAPSAALDRFSDGSLMFILRCWTRIERHEAVSQSLTLAINRAFREAKIQIPFTQSDVHLHWPENASLELQPGEKSNPMVAGRVTTPKSTAAS